MVIRLSHHGFKRMTEMDVGVDEVVDAVECPDISYPSPPQHGPGRRVSVSGRIAVVHTAENETTVITVLWNGAEGRTPTQDFGLQDAS